mmetsp:Transcript_175716/g.558129  ORF Transcript_175716/g.558129 Transcript_175716/m.558129 type:complete len:108 (-) Transcript_175716:37-360(-)
MHADIVNWLFCYDRAGSIQHYCCCPVLQNSIARDLGKTVACEVLSALGLVPVGIERAIVACTAYLTVKGLSGLPLSRQVDLDALAEATVRDLRTRRGCGSSSSSMHG